MADIKDFIFQQAGANTTTKQYEYFTVLGDHDYVDDKNRPRSNTETPNVVAKSIQTDNHPLRYYIKVGAYGRIYNPIGMFSEGTNNKFNAKIGKKAWEFKEVNQKVFDLYTSFLSTKNIAWLNNAERELT
jgi:hypothetical protein